MLNNKPTAAREALNWLDRAYKKEYGAEPQLSVGIIKEALDRKDELEESLNTKYWEGIRDDNAKLKNWILQQTKDLTTANERIAELEETESLEVGKYRSDKERLIKQLSLYGDCPFGSSYSSPDCPDSCPGDTHNNFTECWQSWLSVETQGADS